MITSLQFDSGTTLKGETCIAVATGFLDVYIVKRHRGIIGNANLHVISEVARKRSAVFDGVVRSNR